MDEKDAELVIEWDGKNRDFLMQWSNFVYPLTKEQVIDRIKSDDFHIFIIKNENTPIGTVQLFKFNKVNNSAKIGCFLIKKEHRGKGLGTEGLNLLIDVAFNDLNLDILELSVYDFNTDAKKCYEKCGFVKVHESTRPNGWVGYDMQLKKYLYKKQ